MVARWHRAGFVFLVALALAGCEGADPRSDPPAMMFADDGVGEVGGDGVSLNAKIAEVTALLLELGPAVTEAEAARAAEVAVRAPLDWAQDWRITDPPLIHNFKVTNGLREKGVCQDFADAMHQALAAERFGTLQIHRAIGNASNLRLEHATVILTAPGQPMEQGVILDPWRLGYGALWFGWVSEDTRYDWITPEEARAYRTRRVADG